jgi:hypothetical protein
MSSNLTMWRLLLLAGGALPLVLSCGPPPAAPAPPTAVATATPVHATAVAAVQTGPVATTLAQTAATSIALSPMEIVEASFDPANVGNTSVTLVNKSQAPVDVSGWKLFVGGYRVTLPSTSFMTAVPGTPMIVHLTSSPTPTSGQNVYVGLENVDAFGRPDEDRILLTTPDGQVASSYTVR